MNSSDEAVEARLRELIEAVRAEDDPTFGSVDSVDNLIAAEVAWIQAQAAAVRAGAVADERRRIGRDRLIDTIAAALCAQEERATGEGSESWWGWSTDQVSELVADAVIALLAAGPVPVATPEPDDSRITNQAGHAFTFTVELRGEGFNWSNTMVPQTVRAYDLRAAIDELAKVPFPAWFEEESDEVATPPAEPAAYLGGVRADNAVLDIPAQRRAPERAPITPRDPSQPVMCKHGQSASHYTTVISGLCPGPVSVPKENSE